MNRIILIGNGFDLAHGLKTSYKDFINWYWDEWIKKLRISHSPVQSDELCQFECKGSGTSWITFFNTFFWQTSPLNWVNVLEKINECSYTNIVQCTFLQNICQSIEYNNWVDIEHEYYQLLTDVTHNPSKYDFTVKKLNEQLIVLQTKLSEYLISQNSKEIRLKDNIKEKMFSTFKGCDISIKRTNELKIHTKNLTRKREKDWELRLKKYDIDPKKLNNIMTAIFNIQHRNSNKYPEECYLPDSIMFLNFNYTNTAKLYLKEKSDFVLNHIHGNLDNPRSIIFGYGDELDDAYPEIKKRNDNELLKNMKTIRYSETDNYRKMLSFIESAPYQIFIMGHSCGNSDRTLLNTLFEHDNCVSIKPFYHKKEDGTDNYIELVQNISRNFTDMKKMRDRVVNKTYCEPLVGEK